MALELPDDYETLEAAFALIDEWELELQQHKAAASPAPSDSTTGATDSDDQSTSSSATSSPPPETKSRRRKVRSDDDEQAVPPPPAQMQRREELVFLRRKVREMEAQLKALQEGTLEVKGEAAESKPQALNATWVWQQIASRQLQMRQHSERENLRLRVMVEEQLKVAKELMRVLLRAYQRAQEDNASLGRDGDLKRIKLPKDGLAEISEEMQMQRVLELFEERHDVFHGAPFKDAQPIFRDMNVLEHANGETTINVDSSWVLPFPVEHITNAFWKFLARKTSRNDSCDFVEDGEVSDVIMTKYESTAMANRLVGRFLGRFVGQRFRLKNDGKDEMLMIWDMRAEPVDFKPLSMDGVRTHAEVLMRVVWADEAEGCSNGVGRLAKVQMAQRIHVLFATSETPTRRRRVDALANFLFYNVESELAWKQEVLETLLLRMAPLSASLDSLS